ncbi:hypothetical protein [Deinococcus navajonensis]|uniref:Uncharacterized protein n=1 Tax=Deinococcus navajonensis TaxID=309884 RepID=A0ABV8XHS3_9DEIO
MTDRSLPSSAQATRFVQAFMALMVEHGLSSLEAGKQGGQLGLTAARQFLTSDLTFRFLSPAEHQSAARAYGVPAQQLRLASGPRTDQDIEPFVRAAGALFDVHRVHSMTFGPGGFLGFRADGQSREFVLEAVTLYAQP